MKKLFLLVMLMAATALFADVEVDFDYKEMGGFASNQFALWVENDNGEVVKTLFVTDFTGIKRGYKKRDQSLNHWVFAAKPAYLSNDELDAISGATPQAGPQHFTWNLTDNDGYKVPSGKYYIILEGTLYQGSNVLYIGTVDLDKLTPGELEVKMERSEPANNKNATMLQNVKMIVK